MCSNTAGKTRAGFGAGRFLLHNETAISTQETALFCSYKSAEIKKVDSEGEGEKQKELRQETGQE